MAPNGDAFSRSGNRSIRSRASIFSFGDGRKEVARILNKTGQSKALQYLKRMSIFIVPIGTLIAMSVIGLQNAILVSMNSYQAENILYRDMAVADLIQELQLERGVQTMGQVEDNDDTIKDRIIEQASRVDTALEEVPYWVNLTVNGTNIESKEKFLDILTDVRNETSLLVREPARVVHLYTAINYGLLRKVNSYFRLEENGVIWRIMVAHLALIQSMEHAGIERAVGSIYFRECQLPSDEQMLLLKSQAQSKVLLQVSLTYHTASAAITADLIPDSVTRDLVSLRQLTKSKAFQQECLNMTEEERLDYMMSWFENMTIYISGLGTTRRNLSSEILDTIQEIVWSSEQEMIAYSIGSIVAILLSLLAGFWNAKGLLKITDTIGYHANKLHENNEKLNDERCKTETLLHSMLPAFVARKLKKGEDVPPMTYKSATVYFSDLMGFDATVAKLEPSFAIQLLNDIYTLFDEIIERFEVYKVETVSDHYMVVSGLPEENGEDHVTEIADMGLMLLQAFSVEWRVAYGLGTDLQLRAGFHTGSVVAGVVGKKLPRYCLFGDTVNTASRMQSKSIGGRIQVSEGSAAILRKHEEFFRLEERGKVEFKGKGQMMAYWLYKVEAKQWENGKERIDIMMNGNSTAQETKNDVNDAEITRNSRQS